MNARRTDLALEAHALFRAAQRDDAIDGLTLTERTRRGCAVTTVTVEGEAASRALGKPRGTYVTLDLRALSPEDPAYTERAALALRDELRALLEGTVDTALVVGLGNRAMTPDVIGPRAADHVPATRHLKGCAAFGALADVSVLTPGVLGTTGLEAAELVRGAVETVRPDLVVAVDALASQSLGRVCTTVQLTDAGIVAVVSVTQVLYLSEVGGLILGSKLPLNIWELFVIFLERTIISLLIVCPIAHLLF